MASLVFYSAEFNHFVIFNMPSLYVEGLMFDISPESYYLTLIGEL